MAYSGEATAQGIRHGKGVYRYPGGYVYRGEYRNGLRHGEGRFEEPDGAYREGEWVEGELASGVRVWADGREYVGDFLDGECHGEGGMEWPDGRKYEGTWRNNRPSGTGRERSASGSEYSGRFVEGQRSGEGVLRRTCGAELSGLWVKGKLEGENCVIRCSDGCSYEGPVKSGVCDGMRGYFSGKRRAIAVYEGEWRDGVPMGVAKKLIARTQGSTTLPVPPISEEEASAAATTTSKKKPKKGGKKEEEETPTFKDPVQPLLESFWGKEPLIHGAISSPLGWDTPLEELRTIVKRMSLKDSDDSGAGEEGEGVDTPEVVGGIPMKDDIAACALLSIPLPLPPPLFPNIVSLSPGDAIPMIEVVGVGWSDVQKEKALQARRELEEAGFAKLKTLRDEKIREAEAEAAASSGKKGKKGGGKKEDDALLAAAAEAKEKMLAAPPTEEEIKRRGFQDGELYAAGETGRPISVSLYRREPVYSLTPADTSTDPPTPPSINTTFRYTGPLPLLTSKPTPKTTPTEEEEGGGGGGGEGEGEKEVEEVMEGKALAFTLENGSKMIPKLFLPSSLQRGMYELRIEDASRRQPGIGDDGDVSKAAPEPIPCARLCLLVHGEAAPPPEELVTELSIAMGSYNEAMAAAAAAKKGGGKKKK